jgi:hypothetical protein
MGQLFALILSLVAIYYGIYSTYMDAKGFGESVKSSAAALNFALFVISLFVWGGIVEAIIALVG